MKAERKEITNKLKIDDSLVKKNKLDIQIKNRKGNVKYFVV